MTTRSAVQASPRLVPLAATVLAGAIAALLESTITAMALDQLRRDLAVPVTTVQWVTTAYVLAMAAVIPLVGWSVGRFGARAVWLASLALFLLGSVLCGSAWSAASLIGFRVVQGLGGGMILPLTQLTLARAAGPARLGRVMSAVGLVGQIAPISGPIVGGVLVDSWGWRWVFFVNVPIVLTSIVMAWRLFPPDDERSNRPLDLVGTVLVPLGVVAILHALTGVGTGSGAAVVVTATLGVGLVTAFVVRSLRRRTPGLLDLRLFRDHSFRAGTVMMFALGATTWGPMFLLPLYYQQLRGLPAFDSGLALAPQSLGLAVAFLAAGRYADRLPPRHLAIAGMSVATAATIPFALAATSTDTVLLSLALFIRGVGYGVGSLPVSVALYRTLNPPDIPDATSLSNVVQRIGAASGTTLTAVILDTGGFTPALAWMLFLTGAATVVSAILPVRFAEQKTPS